MYLYCNNLGRRLRGIIKKRALNSSKPVILKRAFERLDVRQDERISRKLFARAMADLGLDTTEEELERILACIGQSQDGRFR